MNRLAGSVSPYLRLHAGNPVDWWPWGADAFAEAARRDVPVFVSIGYATCHWCHVMARESFSDPALAAALNARFVAIKVDREELPDVDGAYLSAAGAFTPNLGWPLSAFVTPTGRMFFAGTYFPPAPVAGVPSFSQVLDAVADAWTHRRAEVEHTATQLHEAIAAAAAAAASGDSAASALPGSADLDAAASTVAAQEDEEWGGFGTAPKFPVAPTLRFLLGRERGNASSPRPADSAGPGDSVEPTASALPTGSAPSTASAPASHGLARRTLARIADSPLFDDVDGGFFRYATRRDWSEPHYERMLYDNAQLLRLYAEAGMYPIVDRLAGFLERVMRVDGGFASAQDSESVVEGRRSEGGYYRLEASARALEQPPALDRKVLTGWNGLAIGALARASALLGRRDWLETATEVAEALLDAHLSVTADGVSLLRASLDGRPSDAPATLEDFGALADALVDLALASGEVRYAIVARLLVDALLTARSDESGETAVVFAVPGGAEPLLAAQGLAVPLDASEGAYPSGWSSAASAAWRLYLLTADQRYADAARAAVRAVAPAALAQPMSYGALLDLASAIDEGPTQLVIVGEYAAPLADLVATYPPHAVVAVVSNEQALAFAGAGFELFEGRAHAGGAPLLYACTGFVCRLPEPLD